MVSQRRSQVHGGANMFILVLLVENILNTAGTLIGGDGRSVVILAQDILGTRTCEEAATGQGAMIAGAGCA